MPECAKYIETNTTAYPCYLDSGHQGPCVAREVQASVRRRERWENAQADLSEFHGRPQKTSERYTLGATPVPGEEPDPDAPEVFIEDVVREVPPSDDADDMRVTRSEDFEAADPEPEMPHEPWKQRPGDQPLPAPREGEAVQERIIAKSWAMHERGDISRDQFDNIKSVMEVSMAQGIERYGDTLKTFNGRNVLTDIAEEARDLHVYLSQAQQAREEDEDAIVHRTLDHIYELHQQGTEATVESIVRESVRYVLDAVTTL